MTPDYLDRVPEEYRDIDDLDVGWMAIEDVCYGLKRERNWDGEAADGDNLSEDDEVSDDVEDMQTDIREAVTSGSRVPEGAYAQCGSLERVVLDPATEEIGEVAFFGCRVLRELELPQGLKHICEEAFGDSGLVSIVIPETVEGIDERAFWECGALEHIEVRGRDTRIGAHAFGGCARLMSGYVACGYPEACNAPDELLYTLLWCSCPEKHTESVSERARAYVRANEALIMEHILKNNNTAAMTGIAREGLIERSHISDYVERAGRLKETEIVALLLGMTQMGADSNTDSEFEL